MFEGSSVPYTSWVFLRILHHFVLQLSVLIPPFEVKTLSVYSLSIEPTQEGALPSREQGDLPPDVTDVLLLLAALILLANFLKMQFSFFCFVIDIYHLSQSLMLN